MSPLFGARSSEPGRISSNSLPDLIDYERRIRSFDLFGVFAITSWNLTFPGRPQLVKVQKRLLPERAPEATHFQMASVCVPARGVGGDYYDFLNLGTGKNGVALADVAGKGIAATLGPGDLLMAYTDSVPEALDPREEEFGEERLKDLLQTVAHLPVGDMAEKLLHWNGFPTLPSTMTLRSY